MSFLNLFEVWIALIIATYQDPLIFHVWVPESQQVKSTFKHPMLTANHIPLVRFIVTLLIRSGITPVIMLPDLGTYLFSIRSLIV